MLDWDDLRFFLAVVRRGSLSAAALDLHVAQSTVGRRLATLEANLGVRLLNRTPSGYVATSAGLSVQEKAERLEIETHALQRDLGGQDSRLSGVVRVTCAESIACHVLAPCFAELQKTHPDILIELIPSSTDVSLAMREADVSVRLQRSNQHDLVIRRVGTLAFSLYANKEYLDRHGEPDFAAGCPGQYLIAQLDDIEDHFQIKWLSDLAPRARITLQTSSHEAAVFAAIHGGGLACLARFRADPEERLIHIPVPTTAPTTDIWLIVHKDNRENARIRVVLDYLAQYFRARMHDFAPIETAEVRLDP